LDWSESAGVKIVTLWLLSNQNLARPKIELDPLLEIIDIAVKNLNELGRWEINPVGSMELLPESLQTTLRTAQLQSKGRGKLMVNVAIGYGGRDEISDAVKAYLSAPENKTLTGIELADKFQPTAIESYLYTAGLPDPDLLIRTSGEQRLGGFMLWQSANSEVYFCDAYWPDFRHLDFLRALRSYSQRQRRFGL
jgi:short-chain Z-isoprenyl diphosphate synthase